MEDIDGGLHPAVDGQSLDEDEDESSKMKTMMYAFYKQPDPSFLPVYRLVGLVVKASASRVEDPGSESRLRRDFSGSSHTIDIKIDTPVATLPGAWRHRVRAGTGRPGVNILSLGEVESWICKFFLSVAARKIVRADPSLRCTSMLLGH